MSNMGYCRFENTVEDLEDCYQNWDVDSDSERKAQKKLVKLCKEIVDDYCDCDD